MPAGRPPKPVAAHKAAHTFRPDRHAEAAAVVPPPPALDYTMPPEVPSDLGARWDEVVSDLLAVGVVSKTDLRQLAIAFRLLGNARANQYAFDSMVADADSAPGDIVRMSGAINASITQYDKMLTSLRRSVAHQPRVVVPDEGALEL